LEDFSSLIEQLFGRGNDFVLQGHRHFKAEKQTKEINYSWVSVSINPTPIQDILLITFLVIAWGIFLWFIGKRFVIDIIGDRLRRIFTMLFPRVIILAYVIVF
jgi:hypothetical protein